MIPVDPNSTVKVDAPEDYKQVIVDPTEYAKIPEKKVYYVNPKVEVTIPEMTVEPKDGGFLKGLTADDGATNPFGPRQFTNTVTTIKAAYYPSVIRQVDKTTEPARPNTCLLYTSDAADD